MEIIIKKFFWKNAEDSKVGNERILLSFFWRGLKSSLMWQPVNQTRYTTRHHLSDRGEVTYKVIRWCITLIEVSCQSRPSLLRRSAMLATGKKYEAAILHIDKGTSHITYSKEFFCTRSTYDWPAWHLFSNVPNFNNPMHYQTWIS